MKDKKFFSKNLIKSCAVCKHAGSISSSDEMICTKKGIVEKTSFCRKFRVDALKISSNIVTLEKKYTNNDFLL